MDRRGFLKTTAATAAGGVSVLGSGGVAAAQPGSNQGSPMSTAQTPPASAARFFESASLNFEFLNLLGGAYYGVSEVGACLAIVDQARDGTAKSAVAALLGMGRRLAAVGEQAAASGQRVSASQAYMQAANYTFTAVNLIDEAGESDQFSPTWRQHQAWWDTGAALLDPPMERVSIPYEGTTLPGYLYLVDDSGRPRPLLILNNGSDGGAAQAWTLGVAGALQRGYNAFTFYGPGQGLALVQQNLYFRPDWEKVIMPVVDYLLTRPEVDGQKLALVGISQGGYWVPRAAAFEQRIAATVADPGVVDVYASWKPFVPAEMQALLDAGQKAQFDTYFTEGLSELPLEIRGQYTFRARPYGRPSPYDTLKAVEQYNLRDVVGQIRCPMLITDPEGEQFWPGQSQELYDLLTGPKVLVKFTAADGADLHCEPKAPGLRAMRIFDWLDATLGLTG
jgi:hypothetical protein